MTRKSGFRPARIGRPARRAARLIGVTVPELKLGTKAMTGRGGGLRGAAPTGAATERRAIAVAAIAKACLTELRIAFLPPVFLLPGMAGQQVGRGR
jgi:hypothetical protein